MVIILKRHRLEVCTDNYALGTEDVVTQLLREFPDIEVVPWRCVSYCHQCFRKPFVLFDGTDLIDAPDAPALLVILRQKLAKKTT